jgi:hypothetical protein
MSSQIRVTTTTRRSTPTTSRMMPVRKTWPAVYRRVVPAHRLQPGVVPLRDNPSVPLGARAIRPKTFTRLRAARTPGRSRPLRQGVRRVRRRNRRACDPRGISWQPKRSRS